MMSAEKLGLLTAVNLRQKVLEQRTAAEEFNDRVRLARRQLAASSEPELAHLVVEKKPMPAIYEVPQVEALTTVAPGSRIRVCEWTRSSTCEDPGHFSCPAVVVTRRSGDDFSGRIDCGFLEEPREIAFKLKHICYVEADGAGGT